ncbi:adhesion G-protein coupled receptor G2-like [Diretmus argenteus]
MNSLIEDVYYWMQVTVDVTGDEKNESDISTWLHHLFDAHLERKTNCTVVLKLMQPTHPCCILRTVGVCLGGNDSIHLVANRVERLDFSVKKPINLHPNDTPKHHLYYIQPKHHLYYIQPKHHLYYIQPKHHLYYIQPKHHLYYIQPKYHLYHIQPKCHHFCTESNLCTTKHHLPIYEHNNFIAHEYNKPSDSTAHHSCGPNNSPYNQSASVEGQANELLELVRDVSNLNSSQVGQLVSQMEALLAGPTVSLALGNTSIHIVSNLLGAPPDVLSDSSNRVIGIVDTVGLKLVLEGDAVTILSTALALSVRTADGTNFQETVFSISDPTNVQVRGDPRTKKRVRRDSSTRPQGSIKLPPSLTDNLSSQEQQQASRVQFNFYQRSTVFQDRSLGDRRLRLVSGVLGASLANLSLTGLQDDVVINLRNTEPIPADFKAMCVFWDFALNNGSGGWNPDGCSVRNSTDRETICGCNHLTSFAILLDFSREPLTNRLQANILTYITYIGCGISAIFLSITLLTYLAFGKLRKDIPSKILIQLCLALLLLNLVFLVDAWLALYPDAVGLCISTAWFLHYFLLASFTWMGLEAIHMYLALVKVFNNYISHYMLKFSLVGWGIPLLVVIIVIAVDKDNYGLVTYGKFTDGSTDDFCWLKNDIAFYVAVVAYFCVIFLLNLIMFVVVMIQLCRIKKQNPHNTQHRSTLQDVRSVAGITILLGLTWGFAFFAWGPVNLVFMYLFAIFNSLQGFLVFLFHCAVKENVRRQWRTYLCCGKMRLAENSEWSRTATGKTARLTSLQSVKSSQSHNSSSSFLVSDPSEQLSSIGSPFEDRAITADEDPSSDVVLNEINRQYRDQQGPLPNIHSLQ